MKSCFLLILFCVAPLDYAAHAQYENNKKPKIVGQETLSIQEDESITILMENLNVIDPDDWFYPWGFTMTVYPGEHYTLSGHLVTPAQDYNGMLRVQVTVHDGEDESDKYDLEITVNPVNDQPVITGHTAVSTNEDQPVAIQREHLKVTDPDNTYPDDFSVKIAGGANYAVEGTSVVPQAGFTGTLSVNVIVNDGLIDSSPYVLPVEVNPVNRVPVITGHTPLQVNEDESIAIQLSDLTVADEDNSYPQGFSLNLTTGENYTISNSTITPAPDFFGWLTVPVTVNDGKNTSKAFGVSISVRPVNDIPAVSELETEPLFYGPTDPSLPVSETLAVSDPDGDSILLATVGIGIPGYQVTSDKLVYTPDEHSNIRGVFDAGTGILTLLGQASPSSYSEAIRSVEFQTLASTSNDGKIIYITVNDGKTDSETVERSVVFGQATVSLDIPTGFTPNGDFSNDTWRIVPLKSEEEFSRARIKVYNKAGKVVYESIGLESEWDGRLNGELLPADTYFYTIDLNINAPEGYLKGLVTILR